MAILNHTYSPTLLNERKKENISTTTTKNDKMSYELKLVVMFHVTTIKSETEIAHGNYNNKIRTQCKLITINIKTETKIFLAQKHLIIMTM